MTVLRGCHVFRLPYAFLKPNVNIRPSENRFARFCETKTDCRKTKRQRQPENRILGFRLPCCLSLQQLYFSPRRAKIPKLKSSRSDTVFGDTVPGKVITHTGIQYCQQFAHTCRNGNLIRLTLGQQALIEIPNKRFKTCRYHGSHIQRLTHRRPSAEAAAFEFGFPALPRVRSNADQTRQPFVVQPSQFGQHRHQRSRRYRTDAFDLLRHFGFAETFAKFPKIP